MSEKIVVPVLGESITEATVAKWLKNAGDTVEADEPIVELETDKVNLEVPSPISGVLTEINSQDGSVVEVGALLGSVSAEGGAVKSAPKTQKEIKQEEIVPAESNVIKLDANKKELKVFEGKDVEEPKDLCRTDPNPPNPLRLNTMPDFARGPFPATRMRRHRAYSWSRRMVEETALSSNDLIWPLFVIDQVESESIPSLPGVERLGKRLIEWLVVEGANQHQVVHPDQQEHQGQDQARNQRADEQVSGVHMDQRDIVMAAKQRHHLFRLTSA